MSDRRLSDEGLGASRQQDKCGSLVTEGLTESAVIRPSLGETF